jgi:hypothetical protein
MRVSDILCDRCGRSGATPFGYWVDRRTDAAGSGEDVTLDADICLPCFALLFRVLTEKLPQASLEPFFSDLKPLSSSSTDRRSLFIRS